MAKAAKFLFFISLRYGAIFAAWWTMITNVVLFVICYRHQFLEDTAWAIMHSGFLLFGMYTPIGVLQNFPERNRVNYSSMSAQAQALVFLAWFLDLTAYIGIGVLGLLTFAKFMIVLHERINPPDGIWEMLYIVVFSQNFHMRALLPGLSWIGFHYHMAAVIRGFCDEVTRRGYHPRF